MISSTVRAVLDLLALRAARATAPAAGSCSFIFRLRPVMMLSSTVMPLNSAMFWNVRAMPMRGGLVRVHVAALLAAGT